MTLITVFLVLNIVTGAAFVHRGQVFVAGLLAGFYVYVAVSALDLLVGHMKIVGEQQITFRHHQSRFGHNPRRPDDSAGCRKSRKKNVYVSHQISFPLRHQRQSRG